MLVSIDKFGIGELVKLTDSFVEKNINDPFIKKCKVGIVLGSANTDIGILYKVHWFPIDRIFYDGEERLENYGKEQV